MFKKFISLLAISVFAGSGLSIIAAPSANATAPSLTWSPNALSSTNSLTNLNTSIISGDGSTKIQITSSGSTSVYVSRNGGSWNVGTGLSSVSSLTGAAVDQTGEHIVITGMANGGMGAPRVAVSSNYGASFTVSTPYPDSNSRGAIKTSVSPDGRTMIIGSYNNMNIEILTSNDFGATWSYKTLGSGNVRIAAASASYLGAGKNVIYAMTPSGLAQHVFASSDSSVISGTLDDVVGVGSSDTTALANASIQGLGVSPDGTHAFVAVSNYAATIKNVIIDSDGKWAFSSAVTPTYSPSTPTVLNGANYGDISALSVSNDGSVIAFSFVSNMTVMPYTSTGYIFTSQDSGATFATPFSNISSYNLGISMTSDGSEQYTTIASAAKYSTNNGLSFVTDTAQTVSSAIITEVAGSADGSVMFLQSSTLSAPPSMLLTRNFGATATNFDSVGGASTSYSTKAYVSPDGTKAMFVNQNYSTQVWSLKEFYGTNFGSSRDLNLPNGITSLQTAAFSPDLSQVLIAARTVGSTGQLFYGTISNGVVTWSSALGDTTTYSGLAVTPAGFYAISIAQTKLYSAAITNGVAGTVTTNSSPFANGFTGTWSSISASSNGRYLVVSNYGTLSNGCYSGGYVYKSEDFGATWAVIPSGASSAQVGSASISADGSILSFGTAAGGYLKVSTDGGATFADQTSLGSITCSGQPGGRNRWYTPFIYAPNGADFGIAVSSSTSVMNTTSYSSGPSLTAQTISFTNPSAMTVGDADQTLTVSASSALTVSLTTADSSICTIVSGKAHAVAAGTCSITAAQAGDSTYSAATSVTRTFTISASAPSLSAQTISFTNPSAMTVGDADQTLTVSASSALAVSLTTANSSICTIVSGKAHAVAAGTCSITASQAGDSTYSAATSVTRTFTISASSSLTQEQIAAEAVRQEAIAKAKISLHELLANGKPGLLVMFINAGYSVANDKTAQRVNDSLLNLPIVDRTKVEKIQYVVKSENFINQVSNKDSQKSINLNQLIEFGFITKSNSNKYSILNTLKKADPLTLTSLEKVQAVVSAKIAALKPGTSRSAAIKAKIAEIKK